MRREDNRNVRILAIDPTTKGFGYAVLEGPESLIDWGLVGVRGEKNPACLQRLARLLDDFAPGLLVIEDCASGRSRRSGRVQELLSSARMLAEVRNIRSRAFSRSKVREVFSRFGATNKHQIATVIAGRFPELELKLPPYRKPWMSEDDRMAIFDSLSFALTFFHLKIMRD